MNIVALMLLTTSLALSNASVPADMSPIRVMAIEDATIENTKVLYEAYLNDFREHHALAQTATVSSHSGVVENTCEASDSFMKTVNDNFNLLPEKMKNKLIEYGWQFKVVSNSKIQEISNVNRSILGFTDQHNCVVYIDNREAASKTILHEAYHAIDVSLGYMSKSNEFEAIYKEELQAFKSIHKTNSYNTNSAVEYFAEAGQVYILNPDKLKEACPQTYDFLEMVINGSFTF